MKIPIYEPLLGPDDKESINKAFDSGFVSSRGLTVDMFEVSFAEYIGVKHAIAVNSGTSALHLALLAAEIGPGDEVIVPVLTYAATAFAVSYTGATLVFVDAEPEFWGMDLAATMDAITPNTRAIIPVHLYGHPVSMQTLLGFRDDREDLVIIEDAAEAHGARVEGKMVGSIGEFGCFSFYGNKIITTGEGGMITTNDEYFAGKIRSLANHARINDLDFHQYEHWGIGYNYHMTNLAAALGCSQLAKIDTILKNKRQIAGWYRERLQPLADKQQLMLHPHAQWAEPVYWMYSVLVEKAFGMNSETLATKLASIGIETRPFFMPMNRNEPYRRNNRKFKVANELWQKGLNLPSGPTLTEAQVDVVCREILRLAK